MKRTTVAILGLIVMLLGSNLWWAYKVLDGGLSLTYLRASYDSTNELARQLRAVLVVLTRSSGARSEVVAAAQSAASTAVPYEKLGYTWVGQLGLKFNDQGKLSGVITSEAEAE